MRSSNSCFVRKTTLLLCIVLIFGVVFSWNVKAIGSIVDALKKNTNEPEVTTVPEPTPGFSFSWVKKEYTDGDVYEGEYNFETDKIEGFGTYCWACGDTYEGMWDDGNASGFGIIRYAGGDSYEGMWIDGFKSGFGIGRYASGDFYEGMWKDGFRSGFGIYFGSADRDYYMIIGEWREGSQNGYSRVHWRDHSIEWGLYDNYEPADETFKIVEQYENWNGFRKNVPRGDGSFYNGEYNTNGRDFVEGYGIMKYPDGSKYIGKFGEGFERDTSAPGILVSPDHKVMEYTEYLGVSGVYARIMPVSNP